MPVTKCTRAPHLYTMLWFFSLQTFYVHGVTCPVTVACWLLSTPAEQRCGCDYYLSIFCSIRLLCNTALPQRIPSCIYLLNPSSFLLGSRTPFVTNFGRRATSWLFALALNGRLDGVLLRTQKEKGIYGCGVGGTRRYPPPPRTRGHTHNNLLLNTISRHTVFHGSSVIGRVLRTCVSPCKRRRHL